MKGFSKVVGTTFYPDNDLSKIKVGQELILIREKDNKFDSNAIAVYAELDKMCKIGHVKKELAVEMAQAIDGGDIIMAEVTDVTGGGEYNVGLNYKFW
jgi:hypothetical protein